ncbi:MAG: HAMP domain-containing histidine kinase [Burkholderiales bacterium]|nr:HAMP domain-containing histidine kinase [Burkholderiales bacterium]
MTVRLRIALTIFVTGLATALGVIATVAFAFQRFELQNDYERANGFLERVVMRYSDILDLRERDPEGFRSWLRGLLLFEPDAQLYVLAADGTVLTSTGRTPLAPGFKVALAPVREAVAAAAGHMSAPYVMGDDPEHMSHDAVVSARALARQTIRPGSGVAGYLYLVSQRAPPAGRQAMFRSSLVMPALESVLAVILVATAMAAWIIATVTRPLRSLSDAVAAAARRGFEGAEPWPMHRVGTDEFGQLHGGFQALLATLRRQWETLRTLDHFRREGVSNLSHDLRSPLTATVACLETLEQRWQGDAQRASDRALVEVALRNTRNAAQLVRSLGDLALLDEPEFRLQPMRVDLGELLDDIALRFADRARQGGVTLDCKTFGERAPVAEVDIELFERAVANLVDNALRFVAPGGFITLSAEAVAGEVRIAVADTGAGIAAEHQPQLFERLHRNPADPAGSEGGNKGLGLAIVKRIAELHRGSVSLASEAGRGTTVTIRLPGP